MQSREVPFSEFVKNVSGGEIRAVTLDGERVRFTGPDNREQFTIRPGDADVTSLLIANDVARDLRLSIVLNDRFPLPLVNRRLDLFYESNAGWGSWWSNGFWKVQS